MGRLAAIALVLLLAVPAGVLAARAPVGSIAFTDVRGEITIKGRGVLLARVDRGSLQIVDLTPADQWSPRVNGVPRGRVVGMRGREVSVFIPGGRFRIVLRGEGLNVSARGQGIVTIEADPDQTGTAGTYAIDDDEMQPLPEVVTRVAYGLDVTLAPVSGASS